MASVVIEPTSPLDQNTAMWWSPESTKIAYYRFDESKVNDYHLQLGQTTIPGKVYIEPYPKAGTPNPIADLFVYDVATKKSVATLTDETGRAVQSEKMLDLVIANGKVVRAGNQFGIGAKN